MFNFDTDDITPPGWILQELREELSISTHDLAAYLGLTIHELQDLYEGDLPVDLLLAERLEYATGKPEIFWIRAEAEYRNGLAKSKKYHKIGND